MRARVLLAAFGVLLPTPALAHPVLPGSEVSYRVMARILGMWDEEIVGINRAVRGEITGDAPAHAAGWVQADATAFRSGNRTRDVHVAQILGASEFPAVRFDLQGLEGFTGEEGKAIARGTLTVHGTSLPLHVSVHLSHTSEGYAVEGAAPVRFSAFGLEPPVLGVVFKRAPEALEIRLKLLIGS